MLVHLMNLGHHWKQRLLTLIQSHQIDTNKMGFPANWLQRDIWR
jgi:hypothetical protein